jgi:lipopolysaccharide transport system ATP-binding protein
MELAVSVDNLSKEYRISSAPAARYGTVRDAVSDAVVGTLRRLRRGAGGRAARDAASQFWALKNVSFDVRPGEMLGIIGHNGAGKSTLLKILSRITAPTSGEVQIRGHLSSLLEVGTGFHPELTGRENVFLNGAIMGMARREIVRKYDEIVEFAETQKFMELPVKRYSSGMYVRLAFAVAAHMSPDVLLIDEVLSVGDLAFQRKCMDHARSLRDRNATVIVVSHNMFAIKAMCDRVVCLSRGQVDFDGDAEEAISRYDSRSRLETLPWAREVVGGDPEKAPIRFKHMEVMDEAGQPRTVFAHGERMRLRFHVLAKEPIANPNLVASFMRSDNVACCNYSSGMDHLAVPMIEGEQVFELLTPPLKLVSELYMIHLLIWDQKFQRLFAAQAGSTFHVRDELLSTNFGVFHEPAEWSRVA